MRPLDGLRLQASGAAPFSLGCTAMVKAPQAQALATILDPRFDPARVAIIDSSATTVQAQPLQTLRGSSSVATVTSPPTARTTLRWTTASAGSALIVSENYFPRWNANGDGKPATVARTNYT